MNKHDEIAILIARRLAQTFRVSMSPEPEGGWRITARASHRGERFECGVLVSARPLFGDQTPEWIADQQAGAVERNMRRAFEAHDARTGGQP